MEYVAKINIVLTTSEVCFLNILFCNLDGDLQDAILEDLSKAKDEGKSQSYVLDLAQKYLPTEIAAKGLLKKYTIAKNNAYSKADGSCEEIMLCLPLNMNEQFLFAKQIQDWKESIDKDFAKHPADGNDADQLIAKMHDIDTDHCNSILQKFTEARSTAPVELEREDNEDQEYIAVNMPRSLLETLELFLLEAKDDREESMEKMAEEHQFHTDDDAKELISDYESSLDLSESTFIAKANEIIRDATPDEDKK